MKKIVMILVLVSYAFAVESSGRVYDCNAIFKERKSELLVELERIDEQKQALSSLKIATEDLLKKKAKKLDREEKALEEKLAKVKKIMSDTQKLVDEKKALLKKIKDIKMSKMSQTYAKMKPASAASILSDMPTSDAVGILQSLKPKVVGKILTKMDPQKASTLTQMMSK